MCNDYEQHVAWAQYCKMVRTLEPDMPTEQSELDVPQADDIVINDMGPVTRAAGNSIGLVPMNFNFPPSGPRSLCSIFAPRVHVGDPKGEHRFYSLGFAFDLFDLGAQGLCGRLGPHVPQ